uniref:Uncharacterized protein n=1 Tax=Anguilla anguilla TaxID=7936 RepID=A0A0E9TIC2_ANGAN
MYWIVPQIVKALPPCSSRRDSPKSANRRCPVSDHTEQKKQAFTNS